MIFSSESYALTLHWSWRTTSITFFRSLLWWQWKKKLNKQTNKQGRQIRTWFALHLLPAWNQEPNQSRTEVHNWLLSLSPISSSDAKFGFCWDDANIYSVCYICTSMEKENIWRWKKKKVNCGFSIIHTILLILGALWKIPDEFKIKRDYKKSDLFFSFLLAHMSHSRGGILQCSINTLLLSCIVPARGCIMPCKSDTTGIVLYKYKGKQKHNPEL